MNNPNITIFYITAAILLPVLFLLSFFFSLSETAIIALSRLRVRHLLAKGVKRAKYLERLNLKLDKVITAMLIGNNVVNITVSVIITTLFVMHFGYKWGSIISTFVSSWFILIFCEITPKILATTRTEKIALLTAPLLEAFIKVFHPVINLFTVSSNFLLKLGGVGPVKRSPLISEEEFRLMIEIGKEEGVLSDEERKMLHRIFEFGDTRVGDVMVPKEKMISVNINSSHEQLINLFVEEGHARLPVYKDSVEAIIGVIYARDLLYILREKGLFILQDLVQEVYRAPGSMRVNELLMKFQQDKIQIAVVEDAQHKAVGLVTLEDLIEEIVGELEEQHHNHRAAKEQKKN